MCLRQYTEVAFPINFVATPRSMAPVFLTSTQALKATGAGQFTDVDITVFAWDVKGKPANGVPFAWRCFVPSSTPLN